MVKPVCVFIIIVLSFSAYAGERYIAVFPENLHPYYYVKDGKATGFSVELLRALAERLDIEIVFQPEPSMESTFDAIRSGTAHLIPNTQVTDIRADFILFSEPYDSTHVGLITLKENYHINSPDDAAGHRVGVHSSNLRLKNGMIPLKGVTYIPSKTPVGLLFNLLSGQVDAIFYPFKPISKVAETMGVKNRLKVIRPHLFEAQRAVGISKKYPELHRMINSELSVFINTEEFAALYKEWMETDKPYWTVRRLSYLFSVVLLLNAAALAIWRLVSLRRKNTELLKTKNALENSEAKFRALAGTTNDIMIFTREDLSEVYFVSKAFEKICGGEIDAFKKDPRILRSFVHKDDLGKLIDEGITVRQTSAAGKIRIINRKTDEMFWVTIRSYRFNNQGSTDESLMAIVITDISEIVKAQHEKNLQEHIIAQQGKYTSMGEMVRTITHQWRQPLNALHLCTQMLEEKVKKTGDKEMEEYIDSSKELIVHMANTITDFRQFFKVDKEKKYFAVTDVVITTLRMMESQIKSIGISYSLKCTCDKHSFECRNSVKEKEQKCSHMVKGVENEFKHAVINILQNAKDELAKSRDSGKEIYIEIKCNGGALICISDNGRGIDEDILERIFEADISNKHEGTGLGLHLTRKIITNMKGEVWAENIPEGGARFNIHLPVKKHLDH